MAYVYILQSLVNSRYYIGSTDDIKRRIEKHNSGKSTYTRLTRPFKLMFYQEYPTLTKARQIEYKLKQLKSKQIIERIISDQEIRIG
ncbi:MAG TPA: GIY-YIG nuclease family protein [Patescibacteria group bacterium]|nr:GIY-YIG nuclease family protein [Patescibacteria group bacterium]